jgi:hypothetical protein
MKMKLQQRLLTILGIFSIALLASCGSDGGSGTAPEKIALANLSGTWNISSADLDGSAGDETDDFTGFKLTISGTFDSENPEGPYDFDVTGNQPVLSPWPQAPDGNGGTWTFGAEPDENAGLMARNDGTGMTYTINDSGQLTITFDYTGDGYPAAKLAQVEGDWTFVFTPAP